MYSLVVGNLDCDEFLIHRDSFYSKLQLKLWSERINEETLIDSQVLTGITCKLSACKQVDWFGTAKHFKSALTLVFIVAVGYFCTIVIAWIVLNTR